MFKTIKRIIDWCGDFRGRLYLGFVFSFFSYWFAAAPVVLAAWLLGKLITGADFDPRWIWLSALAIGALVLLRFLFDYLRARFQETISFELVARDRLAIGDALKRVSLGYFQQRSTGSILSSLTTGLNTLEGMGIRMLDTFVGGYLNFLAILLGLLVLKPGLALLALAAAGISFLGLLLISRCSRKGAPEEAESTRDLTAAALEYARGLPVVKSFGQSGAAAGAMEQAVEDSRRIHMNIEWSFLPGNCLHLLALKCGSVGIALGAFLYGAAGELALPRMLILVLLSLTVFGALEPISDSAHVLGIIDDALDQMEALKEENFIDEAGQDLPLAHFDVEFDHVSFGYDRRQVLKDISFSLPEKTSTAIVGPSGSGKTTLVNLLARFYDVGSGSIRVGGHDLKEFTCDSLLKNISMVFQNVYLFNDTIRRNICFGRPGATEEEMIEAAKKARCHDFIMSLPQGYDTPVGEGGGSLSGGEKQRISIARAMLKNAPIIILDEATASIDPENEHLIQHALTELTRGKTVITIAHRLATVEQADRILVIEDGRLAQSGTHEGLLKQEGLYRRFVETRRKAEGWSMER